MVVYRTNRRFYHGRKSIDKAVAHNSRATQRGRHAELQNRLEGSAQKGQNNLLPAE